MKLIDKLAWIEAQDRRILSTRSKGKAPFYIPGGNREAGETYCQTTFRKIEEKLAVQLAPAMLRFVGNFQAHGHISGVEGKRSCDTGRYSGTIRASAETGEVVWRTCSDRGKVPEVDRLSFDWLKQHDLMA